MIKTFKPTRLIALALILGAITSCYQFDPIDSKERMIHTLKNKGVKPPHQGGDKPSPIPIPTPTPENPDKPTNEFIEYHFSFDTWKQVPDKPYYVPLNMETDNPAHSYWVSASNNGYTNFTNDLSKYPVLELKEAYKNSGVELISRPPIGTFAAFSPKLIAGALYSGHIVGNNKNQNPVRFGQKWTAEPLKLTFHYKYKAGEEAIGGLEGKDQASVNAILYDVTYDEAYLDKHSVKGDSRFVLQAYSKLEESVDWKEITIQFEEKKKTTLDFDKRKYRLAIIFSSSARGDEYIGALGSTLCIDELTLVCKNKQAEKPSEEKPKEEQIEQTHFSFDEWTKVPDMKGTFYTPILNEEENPKESYWTSESNFLFDEKGGNYSYPLQELKEAKQGSGIHLISRGSYPKLPYIFIAGEIHTGYVEPTRFGRDWEKGEPTSLKFHYKYKSGPERKSYIYGGLEGKDKGLVRALLYEVTDDENYYLNKEELKKEDNDRIILEIYQELGEEDWGKEVSLDFNVKNEERYKTLDFQNKKYRLAIIFTSSYKSFEDKGIWDSTLQIDELTIYSKKK